MAKAKNLVIVESPAKAKTIEKYLGSGYKVTASMGHLRDLPKSKMGVDIEKGFEPQYIPVRDKTELIQQLKKDAKSAGTVYLATDPDREGEAISWHLKELLELPDSKARRVTFNEITKKVVTESIQHPRDIDQDLVDAQQARRILDRIVGYTLSPLLWRKVKRGLSAGRVQSVATRMVVDRENEIQNFVKEEYWLLDAQLSRLEGGSFTARFFGKSEKKLDLKCREDVDAVIDATKDAPFTVGSVKRGEKQRSPAPPFITSTLQQEASRRLSMTPRRTMSIAQQLYEGVEIAGQGSVGLITYMRTDSLRLSEEALSAARDFIGERYGERYLPAQPRRFKTKAGAQDAHEAIRPTDVRLTPELVRKDLTQEQYRLYRLIWGRFTACQMANAIYDNVSVDVLSAGYTFRANYSELKFPGYTAVYEEAKDEESDEISSPLPSLEEGEQLKLDKMLPDQQFTQPPARYTEATLIRAMEEKGIGRPSTYAPTITTITAHDYVLKEGKYLRPTVLRRIPSGDGKSGEGPGRRAPEGPRCAQRRALRGLRPPDGGQEGPLRTVSGMPRFPGVHLYQAHRSGDARQMPQMRQQDPQAHLQEGLCVLRLRAGNGLRFYHLGCANQGFLPCLRQDHVQKIRARRSEALLLLRQRGMRQFRPRG